MQRDCVINLGLTKANAEAEEGRSRLTQRPGGLVQLVEGVVLLVSGLHRAKRLNRSVVGAKEVVGSLREQSWCGIVVRTVPNKAKTKVEGVVAEEDF